MDEDTRNYLHNVCFAIGGVAGRYLVDGVRFGRGTGLSEVRTRAVLYVLHDDGYITLDEQYRVTLTPKGARWYARNRHLQRPRVGRIRVQLPITGASVQRQSCYQRLTVPRTRSRIQYHRTIRVIVQLPGCSVRMGTLDMRQQYARRMVQLRHTLLVSAA